MLVFYRKYLFKLVIFACVQFVVLTALAMLFYQGGTFDYPTAQGYSFFTNFLSELGMTAGHAGQKNTLSMVLFIVALAGAGLGLIVFFIGFTRFFYHGLKGKVLSIAGTCFGVIAGSGFIGIALVPVNLYPLVHRGFVIWTFYVFPVAVLIYAAAIFREPDYPKKYAWVFVIFGILLISYIFLMIFTHGNSLEQELIAEVTGQKIIAYSAIITILLQSVGAEKIIKKRQY